MEQIIVGALQTNCYLYPFEGDKKPDGQPAPCAVIDPGADARAIIARIEELKLYPKYIILTHGHFDHTAALTELAAYFGKEALIAIHGEDSDRLGPDAIRALTEDFASIGLPMNALDAADGGFGIMAARRNEIPEPDIILSGGDTIGPFKVIHTPGHTRGSITLYDEKRAVLFTGDTLFAGGVGRTDLPGGDWNELAGSLAKLQALDGKAAVYPGHGDPSTIEKERPFINSLR